VPSELDVTCGDLIVPENRFAPGENPPMIRLHVAIVASQSEEPLPDPFVYLTGGPGGRALDNIGGIVRIFEAVLEGRDLIIFDQRGVGYSEPSLDCPETTDLLVQILDQNLSAEEEIELSSAAFAACRGRLVAEGVDLSAYTSAENAADVRDLQRALDYQEWNLYGVSYGTRLALTVMRDHPEGVRSVILDSVFPPQVDSLAERDSNARRAFDSLFERCAADEACNAAFPELEAAFLDLVAQLDAEPIVVQVQSVDVLLNGDDLIGILFELLYDTDAIPTLPKLIFDVAEGSYDDLRIWVFRSIVQNFFLSEGMYESVQCSEEFPFSTVEQDAAARPDLGQPMLEEYFDASVDGALAICDVWDVPAANAIENQAVVSAIPTLVLAGDYDPVTPPSYGRLAAQTLENGIFVEFPGVGHGIYGARECARQMVGEFLDQPTAAPDTECVDEVGVTFSTP
jgi:pimeloyl-ACP methyl ester carboxylesterase